MLQKLTISAIAALLLAACSSSPSLEKAEELVPKKVASTPEDADACLISTTGADRNGVRLPKAAVKAVRADLKERGIDCGPSVAEGGTGEPASPPVAFDGASQRLMEQPHRSTD
jgi:hypothetical protein